MPHEPSNTKTFKVGGDASFHGAMISLGMIFILLLAGMLLALVFSTTPGKIWQALQSENIQYSIKLSLISCTITAILSLWVAVPIGYLMSRFQFRGKNLLDAFLDIPIVLPPLVVGLGLLVMFHFPLWHPSGSAEPWTLEALLRDQLNFPVTFAIPSVILAQFMVACAFAIRTMRHTFDQINPRAEDVALTLGCNRRLAFWNVVLPEAKRGMITAGTLAWSRALGEFGPILIFSSATRMRTEVLPTTIFLEFSVGDSEAAIAVSLILVAAAIAVLILTRYLGKTGELV